MTRRTRMSLSLALVHVVENMKGIVSIIVLVIAGITSIAQWHDADLEDPDNE